MARASKMRWSLEDHAAWCARDYWDSHDAGHTWAAITSLFTWRDLTGAAKDEYPPRPGEVREEA